MPSKQYNLAGAHPTGGHVIQLEHHRRGRHQCSPRRGCWSAATNVFDKVAWVFSTVPLLWRLHVAPRKPRGSSEEAGQSRSCNAGATWYERLRRRLRSCPPSSEELTESYDIFDGGREQHPSWFDSQLGSDRRANGVRHRLDHDN